ncbi:unnamed protein product [Chrysoparadoxa australica]
MMHRYLLILYMACSKTASPFRKRAAFISSPALTTLWTPKLISNSGSRGFVSTTRMQSTVGGGGEVLHAAHILTEDEATAELVMERLANNEDFATVAQELSKCPSSAKGGDLSWFGRGQMVPEFDDACFSQDRELGSLFTVRTQYGHHVVKLLGRTFPPSQMQVQDLGQIMALIAADESLAENYQLIDVREPQELELASIPGFINLPLSTFSQWGPAFKDGSTDMDPAKHTIVLCHLGMRSNQMSNFLSQAGFVQVSNVSGGIAAYAREVDPNVGNY